ncbi:MAG: PAS domain S-box protein [Bryobacteraceae bacterium]
MVEFLRKLFAADFMPHVYCLRQPGLVILDAASDALIAMSYFLIPLSLVLLVRRRRDLVFPWMFLLFGTFILSCGLTHVLAVWTLWHPIYRFEGLIKAITASASLPTAILLIRLLPQAVSLPRPQQLRAEIAERKRAEHEVRRLNAELENRVVERTAALAEANRMLAESEQHRLLAIEAAEMGTWYWKVREDELFWDDRCKALFGLRIDEPVSYCRFLSAVHPEDRARTDAAVRDTLLTGRDYEVEYRVIWPDHTEHWIRAVGRANGQDSSSPLCMQGMAFDVTRRKRMESDAWHLAALVKSSDDAIISKDLSGVITSWNDGAERIFGYSAQEAVGKHISLLVIPERSDEVPNILDRIRRGERVEPFETVRRRKDGKDIDVSVTVSPIIDVGAHIIGASKIARDISERKRVEEALITTENRFRMLTEAVPDMLFATAADGSVTLMNARFEEYTGLRMQHKPTDIWQIVMHADDYGRSKTFLSESLHTGQLFETECRIRRNDGVFK